MKKWHTKILAASILSIPLLVQAAPSERLVFDMPVGLVKVKEDDMSSVFVTTDSKDAKPSMSIKTLQLDFEPSASKTAMLHVAILAEACPGAVFGSIARNSWEPSAGVLLHCPPSTTAKNLAPWTFYSFVTGQTHSYALAVNFLKKPSAEEAQRMVSIMNSARVCPVSQTDKECLASKSGFRRLDWNEYLTKGAAPLENIGVVERVSGGGVMVRLKKDPASVERAYERSPVIQTTETKTPGGATIKSHQTEGSLSANAKIGCIPMKDVTNKMNPPALYMAARACVEAGQFDRVAPLFATADDFATFDIKRLSDKTTAAARGAAVFAAMSGLPQETVQLMQNRYKAFAADPDKVSAQCQAITKLGPPTYKPSWAINHGMAMFTGNADKDPYLHDVDPKALWNDIVKKRCTPRKQP